MIVSASRRTDIPNYFSDWFLRRLREGFVLVRNPFRVHQVSRVSLTPDVVDGIVFWTKNFRPMMDRLSELSDYPFVVQFTVNPYGIDLEPNVPPVREVIHTFRELSDRIGPERVLWRYDPVLFGGEYTADFHRRAFDRMARMLSGYTHRCTFSFLDQYRRMPKQPEMLSPSQREQRELAASFADSAGESGMRLMTCCEEIDLSEFGISHAKCVDAELMGRISGNRLRISKDKNQRPGCGCDSSIDIGAYGSCPNGCRYCYASYGDSARKNLLRHNPCSPLLLGEPVEDDLITDRRVHSDREKEEGQLRLF